MYYIIIINSYIMYVCGDHVDNVMICVVVKRHIRHEWTWNMQLMILISLFNQFDFLVVVLRYLALFCVLSRIVVSAWRWHSQRSLKANQVLQVESSKFLRRILASSTWLEKRCHMPTWNLFKPTRGLHHYFHKNFIRSLNSWKISSYYVLFSSVEWQQQKSRV